jgi:SpoIIAA-like
MRARRKGVVIAEAHGRVTARDYSEVLMPAIERAASLAEKIRFLYIFADAVAGYEGEAAMEDARLGIGHWSSSSGSVLTDNDAYRGLAHVFGFLMHGEVRVFDLEDVSEARSWMSAY